MGILKSSDSQMTVSVSSDAASSRRSFFAAESDTADGVAPRVTRTSIRILQPPGGQDHIVFGSYKPPPPTTTTTTVIVAATTKRHPFVWPPPTPPRRSPPCRRREDSSEMARLLGHTSTSASAFGEPSYRMKVAVAEKAAAAGENRQQHHQQPLRLDQKRKLYDGTSAAIRRAIGVADCTAAAATKRNRTDDGESSSARPVVVGRSSRGKKAFYQDVFEFWPRKRHFAPTLHDSPVLYSILHDEYADRAWRDDLGLARITRRGARNDSRSVAALLDGTRRDETVWYPRHRTLQQDARRGEQDLTPATTGDDSVETHRRKQRRLSSYPNYQQSSHSVFRPGELLDRIVGGSVRSSPSPSSRTAGVATKRTGSVITVVQHKLHPSATALQPQSPPMSPKVRLLEATSRELATTTATTATTAASSTRGWSSDGGGGMGSSSSYSGDTSKSRLPVAGPVTNEEARSVVSSTVASNNNNDNNNNDGRGVSGRPAAGCDNNDDDRVSVSKSRPNVKIVRLLAGWCSRSNNASSSPAAAITAASDDASATRTDRRHA